MSAPLKFYADLAFSRSSIAGAQKQLSSAFNSANLPIGAVKSFDSALGRVSGRASEFQKSMDAATARVFAFGAAVGVINAVSQSFKALALATIDVEKRLTLISSIFGRSSSSLAKFREDIFSVAKNTGQSFAVVADAATELARQGLSAEETTKRLSDGLILTRISGLASTDAIKTLTSAINGFSEAGLNSSQVINKLIAVDNNFAISAKDLSEALSRVGSTAQDAGVSLDELLGLVTAVQQKTQRGGAVIGNAFKTIFAKTSDFKVIEELKSLGVQIDSSQNGVQKLFAIAKGLEETSDPALAARIKQLTGNIYQLNVVSAALKDISQDQSIFADATERASKASSEAYIQNDKLGKTTAASFASLVAEVTNLSAKIGEITLQPVFKGALNIANDFVEFLNRQFDPETGNKLFQGFFAGIGNFLSGPAIVAIGLAFGRILQLVGRFAKEGLKELFALSDVSRKNVALQKDLNILLEQDETLRKLILSDATTMAQKEQLLFKAISDGNVALAQRAQIMKTLANSAIAAGISKFDQKKGFVNSRGRAGAVPNFAKEYPGLREAILREVTGTGVKPNQVRVNQSSKFITPKNPSGIVVTNTRDEPRGVADIPNYAARSVDEKRLKLPNTELEKFRKALDQVKNGVVSTKTVFDEFSIKVKGAKGSYETLKKIVFNVTEDIPKAISGPLKKGSDIFANQFTNSILASIDRIATRAISINSGKFNLQERFGKPPKQLARTPANARQKEYFVSRPSSLLIPGSDPINSIPSSAPADAPRGYRKFETAQTSLAKGKDLLRIREFRRKFALQKQQEANKESARLGISSFNDVLPGVKPSRYIVPAKKLPKQTFLQKQLDKSKKELSSLKKFATPSISQKTLSGFSKGAGRAGTAVSLLSIFGTQAIEDQLTQGKAKKLGVDSLGKDVDSLTRKKDAALERGDVEAAKNLEKQLESAQAEFDDANKKLSEFSSKTQVAASSVAILGTIIPQLLAAGGNIAKFGLVGLAGAAAAGAGIGIGTGIYKGLDGDNFIENTSQTAKRNAALQESLNQSALAASAKIAESRIKQLGLTSAKVAETLGASFSATKIKAGIGGDRVDPSGRLFSKFGVSGTTGLLERGNALKSLAQEFLPETLRETPEARTRREGGANIAKIDNEIRNIFGELAQPLRSFSDETELAQKSVAQLEKAFLESFGSGPEERFKKESVQYNLTPELVEKRRKSFLERNLDLYSKQDTKGEGSNAILAARANAVLEARKGLGSNAEFSAKKTQSEKLIGQEQSLFSLFEALKTAGGKSEESSLIASITSLAQTIDAQTGDGTSTKISDLVKDKLEERRKIENEATVARKKMELDILAKQKDLQEKLVERLRGVFGQNVDSLGKESFGGKSPFAQKTVTGQLQQTKSILSSLGLGEGEVADLTSKFVNKKGLSFDDIRSSDTFLNRFQAVQSSGFSPQFNASVKEIKGEELLKNFSRSSIAGSVGNVFDFVKKGEGGGFRNPDQFRTSLISASDQIRQLESSRNAGRLSPEKSQELDRLIAAFSTYTLEIGKRGEIFSLSGQNQKLAGIEEKQTTVAKEVDSLANQTLLDAMKSVEAAGLSLSTSVERVTTSIISSSDSIAASLKDAAAKLQNALNAIDGKPSNLPKPTTAAATTSSGN